jgi:hypothetical protein
VFIKTVESRGAVDSGIEFMDVDVMCESLRNYKVEATALLNGDAIFAELTKASQKQRIIVLMSNGAFDNLPKRLSDFFKGQS